MLASQTWTDRADRNATRGAVRLSRLPIEARLNLNSRAPRVTIHQARPTTQLLGVAQSGLEPWVVSSQIRIS